MYNYIKNSLFIFTVFSSGLLFSQQKNILFIAIDDLKPNLNCFGNEMVISPNIDKLSKEGALFTNNQCQQAVCGASRASVLTGWRPDRTQVWDLKTLIRDKNPNVVTMPQYFKNNGYETAATGKIYDPRSVDNVHDQPSWSIPYANVTGSRWLVSDESVSTESADLPDSNYTDWKIAEQGIAFLDQLSGKEKPFFLAVGFKKPHLPFVAPQKYWDLYDRDSIKLNSFQEMAENSPDYVYNTGGELRNNYVDIPLEGDIEVDKQKELIHGYYACVSFIDVQVGRLIAELDSLGIKENTIIVLWGDHGWHLGDHAQWTKHTNFEQATRAPMIIVDPEINGNATIYTPTEFVDIFPTLCDLNGIDIPEGLAGVSLKPLLTGEKKRVKDFALSQYKKNGLEGYTIRTDRYRYTEWIQLEYREGIIPYSEGIVRDRELYDYEVDPLEKISRIYDPAYQGVLDSMKAFLSDFLIHQFNNELPADTTKNILINGGFESGNISWVERACNIELSNGMFNSGSSSMRISQRTKIWGGAAQVFTEKLYESGAGKYIISAYYISANNDDSAKVQIKLTFDNGNNKYIQSFTAIDSTGWSRVLDTVDISWSGNLEEAKITLMTLNDTSTVYYVDDISIIKDTVTTSVNEANNNIPIEFELFANYPNPFNPTTTISFALPQKADVKLSVFNILGEKVGTLVNKSLNAGMHEVKFNAENLSSGIYIYRLEAGMFVSSQKMLLMK